MVSKAKAGVAWAVLSALGGRLPVAHCLLGGTENFSNFFLSIPHFLSVKDGPGGIYLSGQSSNPARRRHLRLDSPVRRGGFFSEFRTCCVW
jgi:hypothetical protein